MASSRIARASVAFASPLRVGFPTSNALGRYRSSHCLRSTRPILTARMSISTPAVLASKVESVAGKQPVFAQTMIRVGDYSKVS